MAVLARCFPLRPHLMFGCFLATFGLATTPAVAQRDLTDIPEPDPVAEREAMRVHELAEVNLFAADPDISKPIQMNFDETGNLWIASSEVYPQIQPGEIANDKIIVLRDSDGDGIADKRTVFAEGLLIPTGVIPDGPHAAYVAESTRLLYLQDSDGDGKADRREVVLSGFGTEDTHHLVHTLRFGPDGCLYFNQSIYIHSHIQTPYGTRHLDGGGIWRYRPTTGQLDVLCKGFVNPWGHTFDAIGESFATDGAFFEGINYVFPDSVFVTSPGASRWLKGLNPGSPKHCGLEVLSGTHVPPEWAGELVTNDFRSHRVCRFTVRPSASGYVSRQQPEIITSQHVAFRPIDARMGPDGALYIADWYNPIIQHGEVDFRDDRRDREHGRIWRVSFPGRDLDPWPAFDQQSVSQLLTLLEDPSLAIRQFSRQELWGRALADPARLMKQATRWAEEQPATRNLELTWLSEVVANDKLGTPGNGADDRLSLNGIEEARQRPYLRSRWRRRLQASESEQAAIETQVLTLTQHENPRVRLEAVVCAGQLDADRYPAALDAVLAASEMAMDPNLEFALWQSIRKLADSFDGKSLLAQQDWNERLDQLAFAVSTIQTPAAAEVAVDRVASAANQSNASQSVAALIEAIALSADAQQLGRVVRTLAAPNSRVDLMDDQVLKPLLQRTSRDGAVPANIGPTLAKLADRVGDDASRIESLATIARTWNVEALEDVLLRAVSRTEGSARWSLIESLGAFDSPEVKARLEQLAASDQPQTRVAATRAIASRRPGAAVKSIVDLLTNKATAEAASQLVTEQLRRKEMPGRIAQVLKQRSLDTDLARTLLRRVRSAGGNAALEQAIRTAGKLDAASWELTPQLQQELLAQVRTQGDPARGEQIYRQEKLQCIQCHAIGVGGGLVGPNLISLGGSSQVDYILESLLDPSAKLKEGYTTLSVLTADGELINGIVLGRDEDSLRMRLADGKEIQIDADSIEAEKPGKSLMPEGLVDPLTQQELVDLTAFLAALGREPEYTVSTEPLVRSAETLIYSPEANRRLNRTSTDTAASDDPAMKWKPITSLVDGTIPLTELDTFKQHRQTPPTSFLRFQVEMPEDGDAKIELPQQGLEAWVDTRPTPVWELQSLPLDAGKHTIVIAIDRTVQTEPFAIKVTGDAAL